MNDLTKQSRLPEVGDYLYASCAGEDYGKIVGVGKDDEGNPTIDIEVYSANDLISCDEDDELPAHTRLELPEGVNAILRGVRWKPMEGYEGWDENKSWVTVIVCNTPGNNCFRCTKLFSLRTERTKF